MWKLLVLQKPDSVSAVFNIRVKGIESEELIDGFKQMLEMVSFGGVFFHIHVYSSEC